MKLVVVIMGQNCERTIGMCLESVKEADAIVYCDGGSKDTSAGIAIQKGALLIQNEYDQEDKQMNGKQRNFYLEYVKKNYPDYWCLALDADEVVEDLSKIKDFIKDAPEGLYSPKMRHFIGDLGHEDATVGDHWVLNRLFKISEAIEYPLVEHPVLQGNNTRGPTDCTVIWHLAYVPNMWEIKKRYENHLKKSNMHTPEFLKNWYYAHLFGAYPKSEVKPIDIPGIILNNFGIDKDQFYFANRGVEIKHGLMVNQWNNYFKPDSVLDIGCGRGPHLFFWNWFVNDCSGIELSKWAIDHAFVARIKQGSVSVKSNYEPVDLIVASDILEHLSDEDLDLTLSNIKEFGKRFLFSVPVKGDPNLLNDSTHKQFKTREEWIQKWKDHGIEIIETPKDWLFAHQLFVGKHLNS